MTVVGIHPEELFDKLLDGEITSAERERLSQHLEVCAVCRFEHAARFDFQAEALLVSALGPPPALPLRPLPLVEEPAVAPAAPVRRRRSRLVLWGVIAAALITASGALAAGVAGKTPWHVAVQLFSPSAAAPTENIAVAPAHQPSSALAPSALSVVSPPLPTPAAVEPSVEPSALGSAAAPLAEGLPRGVSRHHGARDGLKPKGAEKTVLATLGSSSDAPAAANDAVKEPANAAKLFGDANQARRSGDFGRAAGLYHLLQDQFPGSPEAELSRVTLALLLLDSGDAQSALSGFDRYLAGSSRGLEAEALVGRARALGRLGRREQETAAWREVKRKYPSSIYGRQATERLLALGQP